MMEMVKMLLLLLLLVVMVMVVLMMVVVRLVLAVVGILMTVINVTVLTVLSTLHLFCTHSEPDTSPSTVHINLFSFSILSMRFKVISTHENQSRLQSLPEVP